MKTDSKKDKFKIFIKIDMHLINEVHNIEKWYKKVNYTR